MFENPLLLLASFLIGSFGACVYLFMLWAGFKEVSIFPEKKLLSAKNLAPAALYTFIGGGIALILQVESDTWSAFYALMLGMSWPGFIAGYLGTKNVEKSKESLKEVLTAMGPLTGEKETEEI